MSLTIVVRLIFRYSSVARLKANSGEQQIYVYQYEQKHLR